MEYDTREGIASQLGSYEEFYALMNLRRQMGRVESNGERGENSLMTPFTILGRYTSGQFGQCLRLDRQTFTDADREAMPAVMTYEEFKKFLEQNVTPRGNQYYSLHEGVSGMAPTFPLPPPHIVCAKCGGGWELSKCHDIDADGDFENVNLLPYLGKTLREAQLEIKKLTDASRAFGGILSVQNARWADPNVNEEWDTAESVGLRNVSWDYVIQAGDSSNMFRYRYYHGECFRQLQGERAVEVEQAEVQSIKESFENAGFEDVRITRASLPEHLRKWIASESGRDPNLDQVLASIPYYRIETKQGLVGMARTAYLVFDLEGCGFTFRDLEPKMAAKVPSDFPPIAVFGGESEQLLRLWQLMVKNQSKT